MSQLNRQKLHRGADGKVVTFGQHFVAGRLAGFEKDMEICLAGIPSRTRYGVTHAYFPALAACCGTLEYLTALRRGNTRGIGWQQVTTWAQEFMPQPEYSEEIVRVLFEAMRHPVAHRGIASGVWVDRNAGPGQGRRVTWKLFADSKRPACHLVAEEGKLLVDSPWPCAYSHRVHIHLKRLSLDIRTAAENYRRKLAASQILQASLIRCLRQLYPA